MNCSRPFLLPRLDDGVRTEITEITNLLRRESRQKISQHGKARRFDREKHAAAIRVKGQVDHRARGPSTQSSRESLNLAYHGAPRRATWIQYQATGATPRSRGRHDRCVPAGNYAGVFLILISNGFLRCHQAQGNGRGGPLSRL